MRGPRLRNEPKLTQPLGALGPVTNQTGALRVLHRVISALAERHDVVEFRRSWVACPSLGLERLHSAQLAKPAVPLEDLPRLEPLRFRTPHGSAATPGLLPVAHLLLTASPAESLTWHVSGYGPATL